MFIHQADEYFGGKMWTISLLSETTPALEDSCSRLLREPVRFALVDVRLVISAELQFFWTGAPPVLKLLQ